MNTIKNNKGFTLIELLVVISIIGLLSSIVLASLKGARDKSNVARFRAEINQTINALELYRSANGKYPYEDTSVAGGSIMNANWFNDNTESVPPSQLSSILAPFMKNLPRVPNPTTATVAYSVRTNVGSGTKYRCAGDTGMPKYVLLVYQNNLLLFSGFTDWPYSEYSNDNGTTWSPTSTSRCFSMK